MFSLLHGLWKYLFQKDDFFVVLLGLDNAGKTTFLEQTKTKFNKAYKGMNLSRVTTTVGLNIGRVELQGIKLNFWDLGGQQELQSLWDKYYVESHGVIFIVDSSDTDRIEDSREAFEKMIKNETLTGAPLLLVANKQDMPDALSLDRIKEIFKSSFQHIGQRDFHCIEASALRGDGINESIEWMAQCIKRNRDTRPPRSPED